MSEQGETRRLVVALGSGDAAKTMSSSGQYKIANRVPNFFKYFETNVAVEY